MSSFNDTDDAILRFLYLDVFTGNIVKYIKDSGKKKWRQQNVKVIFWNLQEQMLESICDTRWKKAIILM